MIVSTAEALIVTQLDIEWVNRHLENLETMKNTKKNHKFEHVNLHVQNHKNVWTLHFGCSRRRSIGSVSTVCDFVLFVICMENVFK